MPTGLIDDQHRMGAGIDGGTDPDEVRRHGVGVAPGHDQPGAFPLRGTDRAEDIGPFGALVAGRPRARATSGPIVSLFFWPISTTPFGSLETDLRFGGEVFFKSLDGQLVLREWRGRTEILAKPSAFNSRPTVVSSSEMANVSKSHRARFASASARR